VKENPTEFRYFNKSRQPNFKELTLAPNSATFQDGITVDDQTRHLHSNPVNEKDGEDLHARCPEPTPFVFISQNTSELMGVGLVQGSE
jgi:hypothetical protein